MNKFYRIAKLYGALVIIIFLSCLSSGCSEKYLNIDEKAYKSGTVVKKITYWKDKNTVDRIVTEYRLSEMPAKEREIFQKPLVQYFSKSKLVLDDDNTLYEQEVDAFKSYTARGVKAASKTSLYIKNGKIIAYKIVFNNGIVSNFSVEDDNGVHKVFFNHLTKNYLCRLEIYKDGELIQRKEINLPVNSSISRLQQIE